ncbi:MAG: hypothetical protein Q8Q08_09985 [Candidatus Omnitrophota bacterium]|nr:hypothetical protein [Candidatus Omnitrophota bacterium]
MDLVITAVKTDLFTALDAGRYMLTALFIVAVFRSYLDVLNTTVNWSDVIIRLVIGFALLQNYTWIMDTTRDVVIGVDEKINPDQSYINQYAAMSDNMQKEYEANTQTSFVSNVSNFLFGKFTLHTLIINLSFIFYAVVSNVMEAVRYSLVGILYKMGPILVPLILFKSTGNTLKGWFTSYVSVLCWPILWHIALSVAVALSAEIGASGQGIEQFACLNFAVCFVLVFSPMIVSSLVAGVGMGASAAVAGLMANNSLFNTAFRSGQSGLRSMGSAIQDRLVSRSVPPIAQTPTTMGGVFKDILLGSKSHNKG